MQNCCISNADTLEIKQFCTKPMILWQNGIQRASIGCYYTQHACVILIQVYLHNSWNIQWYIQLVKIWKLCLKNLHFWSSRQSELNISCDVLTLAQFIPVYPTMHATHRYNYRKISDIRSTKSSNWNVSHLVLQLPLPNPMMPGVKSRMKM